MLYIDKHDNSIYIPLTSGEKINISMREIDTINEKKLIVAPLLIADYRKGELDTGSKVFKVLAAIACLIGLMVPVIGANPIAAQVATQISQVFVLPLVIVAILFLVNRRSLMGTYKAGILLNLGMLTALVFSFFISYTAVLAIIELFRL